MHGEQRKDLAALRHVADAGARARVGRAGERRALEEDAAAGGRLLADDGAQQAGLADAVAAEHAGHLAGLGGQADAAQRLGGAVVEVEVFDAQHAEHLEEARASPLPEGEGVAEGDG